MLDRLFGGDVFLASTRALDAASLRHEVISNNLANYNTPNFKRQEVQFETQLSQALARKNDPCAPTGASAVAGVKPNVVQINTTSTRLDGNNVDIENEMSSMAANTLNYEVLSQSVAGYFTGLKSVINSK